MTESNIQVKDLQAQSNKNYRIQAGAFLGLVGGLSALFAFSRTLVRAKKDESKLIEKGGRQTILLLDEGSMLALRALGYGTLYAVLGTGTLFYGIWKLSGAKNFEEFRQKMGGALPRLTSETPPSSRTDFDGLTDLMKYLATWGKE